MLARAFGILLILALVPGWARAAACRTPGPEELTGAPYSVFTDRTVPHSTFTLRGRRLQ